MLAFLVVVLVVVVIAVYTQHKAFIQAFSMDDPVIMLFGIDNTRC
jgi:hypothetical protein